MGRKKEKDAASKSVKEKITDIFDMPNDVVLGSSKVTVIGVSQVNIENYGGIMEYSEESVRIKTPENTIIIQGVGLNINSMTDTDIYISGKVISVRWE